MAAMFEWPFKVNLGSGMDIKDGWYNVDANFTDNVLSKYQNTVKADVLEYIMACPNDSICEIKAHHVLEHLVDLDLFMVELHRACISCAKIDIVVPLANTLWDVANPDHKRRFNHRTFQYYTTDFITSDLGLFKGYKIVDQKIEREQNEWFGGIEWIVANLHVWMEVVK